MNIAILALIILFAAYLIKSVWSSINQSTPASFYNKSVEKKSFDDEAFKTRPVEENQYDVIVVGCGVVGSALAASLGKMKKNVLCIERDLSEPDRIVGELLQPGGVNKLKELGLEDCLEGIDSATITGYGVFMNNEKVDLLYPQNKNSDEKVIGRSFHHGRFVNNLRNAVKREESVRLEEGSVVSLLETKNNTIVGVEYRMSDGTRKKIYSPLTIVANGAGSALTRKLNTAKPTTMSTFVGIEMKDNAADDLPFKNHGNVFMVKPGPVLCYPISSTEVRCLIDFPSKMPSIASGEMQKYLIDVIAPQMPKCIRGHFISAVNNDHIRSVPNREMPAEAVMKRGGILLGDAFNCRHPLTGGGMTVGFSDCVLLRNVLSNSSDFTNYDQMDRNLSSFYVERRKMASTINILANALYAIFAPRKDPMVPYMKQAVFEYFKIGGICASGPVGLLSGLIESPYVLISHFFAVALVFCAKHNFPFPTPNSILRSFKLLKSATYIVAPLITDEGILRFLFPSFVFSSR